MDLGMFMMPIHPSHRAVADTLAEDIEKVVLADKLGFAEAWIGEHFTATTEPITAPLMFMAACLPQTKRITFATGVVNMPVHHPIIVAAELAQFDHLSRGRLIFGIGPGALASDWEVFKTGEGKEREERTLESIGHILKIWTQDPPYNLRGKFWDIVLEKNILPDLGFGWLSKPYQKPHPPIAMSIMSPFSGSGKTAGLLGWIPISANFIPEYSVASHWQKFLEGCDAAKREPDGKAWRVARNILVAPTDEEAREIAHSEEGALHFYFSYLWRGLRVSNYTIAIKPDPKMDDSSVTSAMLIDSMVIYGSPKTVTDKLVAFREKVGPFGHLILGAADWEGKNRKWEQRSMTLLAEKVMPEFNKSITLTKAR
jgi:alkanesulfonate monooxygenase SsuD/methylene tetrahydromethanopterin reductase-like flavin-dependent oxidoreductase (luciferase family)